MLNSEADFPSNSPYSITSQMHSPASTVYSPDPSSNGPIQSPASSISITSHQPRQRLRPWLIDQINSRQIPGLDWLDKDKMIFRIPWKHFGRPGVDEHVDAMLFRNWALHTNKYQEGQPADISTWKTRFRCALHKLPDIEELHSMNQTEGDDPHRVYQFKEKERRTTPTSNSGASVPSTNMPLNLPANVNPVVLSPAPGLSPGYASEDSKLEMPNMLPNNLVLDDDLALLGMDGFDPMGEDFDLDPSMLNPTITTTVGMMNLMPQQNNALTTMPPMQSMEPFIMQNNQQPSSIALSVKLYYADHEVGEKIVDNPKGLRIAFNPPPPLPDDIVREDTSQVVSHIFGPLHAEQIYFPESPDKRTMSILECIKRGLVIQARNGEILATRLCRAKVFYCDKEHPTTVKELPREHTTVVFDYVKEFLPQLQSYMLGQAPLPTYERYFSFGQKWSQNTPLRNNYVYVNIAHCLAKAQIAQVQNQGAEVLVSDPNMLDEIAKQIEQLKFKI